MTGAEHLTRYIVEARVSRGKWEPLAEFSETTPARAVKKARNFGRVPVRFLTAKLRARAKEISPCQD